MKLRYAVAKNPGDYQRVHSLLKKEGVPKQVMGFPTVMAFDDGELVGCIGTHIQKNMIIAGPLVVESSRRRVFTVMRLCEAYQLALASMGIKAFILSVEIGSLLDRGIGRYYPDAKPYAVEGNRKFYAWRTLHGLESERSGSLPGGTGAAEEPGRTPQSTADDHRADAGSE